MRLLVDTHTHTTVSGHAYSTLLENLEFASSKGLSGICVTDHAESVIGAQPNFCVGLHVIFPEEYKGVRIISGAELNIIDYDGNVDMEKKWYEKADFLIASLHDITIEKKGMKEHTSAMLGAIANPYIDIIGHPGNSHFEVDIEAVVLEAKKYNKLIEVNNHSFAVRAGSEGNCKDFIRLCKKHDVRICVGSDAHICFKIGAFENAIAVLIEEEFPKELIVSATIESFDEYLRERKARIAALSRE